MKYCKVKKGYCPICASPYGIIAQHYNTIVVLDTELIMVKKLFLIPRKHILKYFVFIRLFQRLLRLNIRAGKYFKNKFIFSDLGSVYSYDFLKKMLLKNMEHRKGMRSPLDFTVVYKENGEEDYICFGDYFSNDLSEEVGIYKSEDGVRWEKVYVFPKSQIRHIHGIFQDNDKNRILILSGDKDLESGIWESYDNLKTIDLIIKGSQQYRSCQMFFNNKKIYYITDSEYELNHIYKVENDEFEKKICICNMPGSVINGVYSKNKFIFSTTVEPSKGGIESRVVKVYLMDNYQNIHEICSFQKDNLPFVFQYGTTKILLYGCNAYLYPIAVKKFDNCILKLAIDEVAHNEMDI